MKGEKLCCLCDFCMIPSGSAGLLNCTVHLVCTAIMAYSKYYDSERHKAVQDLRNS